MQKHQQKLQMLTVGYFLLVMVLLLLAVRVFSGAFILEHMLWVAAVLVLLWFLLFFAVLRRSSMPAKTKEKAEEEQGHE